MPRFLAVLLAAFACLFIYLVATGIALPQAATVRAMFVVASVALALSAAATTVAVVTAAQTRTQRTALQNLARSVDAALHDLASHKDRDGTARTFGAAESQTAPVEEIAKRQPDTDRRPIEIAVARSRPVALHAERGATGHSEVAAKDATFRLRPLLAVATGHVAGFDVLAAQPDGRTGPAESRAASERDLVLAAIKASAGPDFAEHAPLHVAISQALLADRVELAAVVDALRRLNGTARSIVLSLPTELMEKPARHSAALARLAASGPRLAAEGWPGSAGDIEALWRSGVSFLRLPAARLLAHEGDGAHGAASLIRTLAASGMTAIATGVESEAEATGLARLGIMLMTATPHEPAPSKSGNGAGIGDAIHI
jgi:hypothetical protein